MLVDFWLNYFIFIYIKFYCIIFKLFLSGLRYKNMIVEDRQCKYMCSTLHLCRKSNHYDFFLINYSHFYTKYLSNFPGSVWIVSTWNLWAMVTQDSFHLAFHIAGCVSLCQPSAFTAWPYLPEHNPSYQSSIVSQAWPGISPCLLRPI